MLRRVQTKLGHAAGTGAQAGLYKAGSEAASSAVFQESLPFNTDRSASQGAATSSEKPEYLRGINLGPSDTSSTKPAFMNASATCTPLQSRLHLHPVRSFPLDALSKPFWGSCQLTDLASLVGEGAAHQSRRVPAIESGPSEVA